MKKTHKKIENNLQKSLTIACEQIKDITDSFCWLTHQVNYDVFPTSLMIICYFIDNDAIVAVQKSELDMDIKQVITKQLKAIGVDKFNLQKQIKYLPTPKAC